MNGMKVGFVALHCCLVSSALSGSVIMEVSKGDPPSDTTATAYELVSATTVTGGTCTTPQWNYVGEFSSRQAAVEAMDGRLAKLDLALVSARLGGRLIVIDTAYVEYVNFPAPESAVAAVSDRVCSGELVGELLAAAGPSLPAGTSVRVIATDGRVLHTASERDALGTYLRSAGSGAYILTFAAYGRPTCSTIVIR